MTASLKPLPGFQWDRIAWGQPDSPRSAVCSYCFTAINDGDVPLILWTEDGHLAQFCDECQRRWWGVEGFDDDDTDA